MSHPYNICTKLLTKVGSWGGLLQKKQWDPLRTRLAPSARARFARRDGNFTPYITVSQLLDDTFTAMKLRDRHHQLQDPTVVKAMVLRSVYASMALENQTVPMERLEALYAQTEPQAGPSPAGAAGR